MEILEAYDLTGCAHSAAALAGVDAKTVGRYVAVRDNGGDPHTPARRTRVTDPFVERIVELVEFSEGRIRADVVHRKLVAMGYPGTDRTTRRAVVEAKVRWRSGYRRCSRPWVPEPGKWLQLGWADGPRVGGRGTLLFCGWLSWSRFHVVLPAWEPTHSTLASCLDSTLRLVGGAPAYLLTGVPRPEVAAAGRHYGCTVKACETFDPGSGAHSQVAGIAAADLAPTPADLLSPYSCFADLTDACVRWTARTNSSPQPETGNVPLQRLRDERRHLHSLPARPYRPPGQSLGESAHPAYCRLHLTLQQVLRSNEVRDERRRGLVRCGGELRRSGPPGRTCPPRTGPAPAP